MLFLLGLVMVIPAIECRQKEAEAVAANEAIPGAIGTGDLSV